MLYLLNAIIIIALLWWVFVTKDTQAKMICVVWLICSPFLLVVNHNATQEALRQPVPWWMSTGANLCMQVVMLVIHLFMTLLLTRTLTFNRRIKIVCYGTMVSALIMVAADISRRNHFVSVTDPFVFERSFVYALSHLGYTAALFFPIGWSTRLLQKSLRSYNPVTNLPTFIRILITLIGYVLATSFLIIEVATISISFVFDNSKYVPILLWIQTSGRVVTNICSLFGGLMPQKWLIWLLQPIQTYFYHRQQRQDTLVATLHTRMLQIVPKVHIPIPATLHVPALSTAARLVEISDARRFIWSHEPRVRPLSPKDEARHLFDLLCSGVVLEEVGVCDPPQIRQVQRHNLAVAQHLLQLEQQCTNQSRD